MNEAVPAPTSDYYVIVDRQQLGTDKQSFHSIFSRLTDRRKTNWLTELPTAAQVHTRKLTYAAGEIFSEADLARAVYRQQRWQFLFNQEASATQSEEQHVSLAVCRNATWDEARKYYILHTTHLGKTQNKNLIAEGHRYEDRTSEDFESGYEDAQCALRMLDSEYDSARAAYLKHVMTCNNLEATMEVELLDGVEYSSSNERACFDDLESAVAVAQGREVLFRSTPYYCWFSGWVNGYEAALPATTVNGVWNTAFELAGVDKQEFVKHVESLKLPAPEVATASEPAPAPEGAPAPAPEVNMMQMLQMILSQVQEQNAKIDAQNAEIKALREEVAALRAAPRATTTPRTPRATKENTNNPSQNAQNNSVQTTAANVGVQLCIMKTEALFSKRQTNRLPELNLTAENGFEVYVDASATAVKSRSHAVKIVDKNLAAAHLMSVRDDVKTNIHPNHATQQARVKAVDHLVLLVAGVGVYVPRAAILGESLASLHARQHDAMVQRIVDAPAA